MADKHAPASAAEAPAAAPKKKSGKLIIVAAGVLLLEVATVAVTMSMSSGPKKANAELPVAAKPEQVEHDAEVKLIEAKLANGLSGHIIVYDLQVVAKVADKNKAKVTDIFTEREAEIKDQVRMIIASSDPKTFAEPGLETLKRQISYQVEQIVGKDMLKDVLIPKCSQITGIY